MTAARGVLAAGVVALLASACAGAPPAPSGGAGRAPAAAVAPDPATVAAFDSLYEARIDRARERFTEADVRFMNGMIAHHAQALAMASMAPPNGASPSVRTLAARIDSGQRDEIGRMQQWLRDRGRPVPEVMLHGTEVMVHGAGEHHMHGPGMLSDEQMAELARARGAEFDRLFLTYMIMHHEGAVHMVDELFAADGAAQDLEIFKFASDVHVDQSTEIARMRSMLDALAP